MMKVVLIFNIVFHTLNMVYPRIALRIDDFCDI